MKNMQFQKGFAALGAVLIVVTLAIAGGAGYVVWHSRQASDKPLKTSTNIKKKPAVSKQQAAVDDGLDLSTKPTYYDCKEAYYSDASSNKGNLNEKTGLCTLDGKDYTYPTAYTDDMIRETKGLHFTEKEVTQLRKVGKAEFTQCTTGAPDFALATVSMHGEASGKYLYYGVGCQGGYRELSYLDGDTWKVIYQGQDYMACSVITKYNVPHSLFASDPDTASCYDASNKQIKITDL